MGPELGGEHEVANQLTVTPRRKCRGKFAIFIFHAEIVTGLTIFYTQIAFSGRNFNVSQYRIIIDGITT